MYRISVVRDGDRHSTYWARDYGLDRGNLRFSSVESGSQKTVSASCQWIVTEDPDTLPPAVQEAVSDSEEAPADD